MSFPISDEKPPDSPQGATPVWRTHETSRVASEAVAGHSGCWELPKREAQFGCCRMRSRAHPDLRLTCKRLKFST